MRFREFADMEEQFALLRLIVDNTWNALEQYAMEQRRATVQRQPVKGKRRIVKRRKLALQPRNFRMPQPKFIRKKAAKPAPKKPVAAKPKPLPLQHKHSIKPIAAFSLQQGRPVVDGQASAGV